MKRRRRRRRKKRKKKKQRPAVPLLQLQLGTGSTNASDRPGSPDMHADVLKDLTGDSDDDMRAGGMHGVPPSPIRSAPRITPITARTAGRGVNTTHKGRLQRASQQAWMLHDEDRRVGGRWRGTGATSGRGGGGDEERTASGGLPRVPQTARF